MYYLVKDNMDGSYSVSLKMATKNPVRKENTFIVSADDYNFPLANLVDNEIEISNDAAAQAISDAADLEDAANLAEKEILKANFQQLQDDIEAVSNIASLKVVLRKLAKGIKYSITKD